MNIRNATRRTRRVVGGLVALYIATGLACGGGSDGTGVTPPPGGITVSLSAPSLSVTQGQSGTIAMTLTRTNGFGGAVDLLIEGAPAGVTVTCTPCTIPSGSASSSLEVAVARTVAPATHTVTVRGRASGVSDQLATFSLTVGVAGGYTLSLSPTGVSVAQGASATSTVSILRTGGFSDAVALTVSGAPAGVTAVVSPTSFTEAATAATLTITVASNAAAGNFTLIAHGSATGLSEQTASLPVQVTAVASGASVTLQFCDFDVPIWFATQSEAGAWTQIAGSAGSFTFAVGSRGAIATVTNGGSGYETAIIYASGAELEAIGHATVTNCVKPREGSKHLSGTVANLATTQFADISLGGAFAFVDGSGSKSFTLDHAPDAAADLIAVREDTTAIAITSDKLIVRRGVNLPTGATIPTLDFAASEAIAAATANLTLTNVGGDSSFVISGMRTANNTAAVFTQAIGTTQFRFSGLPTSQVAAGDVHFLGALVVPPTGFNSMREVDVYTRFVGDQTLALGPALATPSISVASATAPQRMRAQLAAQSAYPNNLEADFWQSSSSGGPSPDVTISITAAYLGSSASSWDVTIPDLSAAGYAASWGLAVGTPVSWSVIASSFPSVLISDIGPPEGTYVAAVQSSDASSLSVLRRAPRRSSPAKLWRPARRAK